MNFKITHVRTFTALINYLVKKNLISNFKP